MYLKNIAIKNIGPINELSIALPFNEDGTPKPILLVGQNGSGKTVFQSQIIDSFYEITSAIFQDVGVQDGQIRSYYKVSGGLNLQSGQSKGFSYLNFSDNKHNKIEYLDKMGSVAKEEITKLTPDAIISPDNKAGNQKILTDTNVFKEDLSAEWLLGVYIFQPAYRFEEPFWKNQPFTEEVKYKDKKRFSGNLNKEIEIVSSSKENKSFLLDLVLDFEVLKAENDILTWTNINKVLRAIKKQDNIRFGIGPRGGYRVSIGEQDHTGKWIKQLLPSIDNLSLGESILLNLFINIIRHGDTPPKRLGEIQGIVAIDEIDVHLHNDLQNSVLPALLKMFPKVQFIITTHSPLFVLGMKNTFGESNFEIRNMPDGEQITTERFSEFESAYEVLKSTEKFEKEIDNKIEESKLPIIFVEGDYDIRYIKKASQLFDKEDILGKVSFIDADGYNNLNKIWQHKTNLFHAISQKMLLLYDCDTKIDEDTRDKIFKRIIPYIDTNLFDRGIENLFPKATIDKARAHKAAFIDYISETEQVIRGEKKTIPEQYKVNLDEKGNLCNWLCECGTKDDFANFQIIFDIIEQFLKE